MDRILRLLVMGEFAGSNTSNGSSARNRRLIVSRDDFQSVMSEVAPALSIQVPDRLAGKEKSLQIDLKFSDMASFRPESIARQVAPLRELLSSPPVEATGNLDRAASDQMDEILHHPQFQRLESAWRGLHMLTDRSSYPGKVQLELLSVTRKELAARFEEEIFQPEYDGLSDVPLTAVLADFEFSHRSMDLDVLQKIAHMAKVLQIAFIASVATEFFGIKNIAHLPALPDLEGRLIGSAYASWNSLQQEESARWASLSVNRFLLRAPYGPENPTTEFNYTEKIDAAHPEHHLWGRAIWLIGCALARSFNDHGHPSTISGLEPGCIHKDLLVRALPSGKNEATWTPVEVLIPEEKAWDLAKNGLTPLVGMANGNVAYFPLVSNLYRRRPPRVTLDSALSYHLYAAHLAHFLLALQGELPAGSSPEQVARTVQEKLHLFIAPFAGEKPEDTVKVEMAKQKEAPYAFIATVHIQPRLKIEGKEVAFTLQLPVTVSA